MGKTRVKGLNKTYLKNLYKSILDPIVEEQTGLLVEYARTKIIEIGDYIQTAPTENHMDRTGHLLNSLCWGVSYQGKLVDSGFYRNAVTHKKRQSGWNPDGTRKYTNKSELHEWNPDISEDVNGRQLAREYLKSYGNNGSRGWRVFFAILAPYWGYWEKGFRFDMSPRDENYKGRGFLQFAVMTYFYDQVRRDLKPARVRFRSSVPKYNIAKLEQKAMR